ncbi:MAG: ABC transporter permease subunit [Saccharospirillaceae bacterium]|nr:ABC transporter permease subunit [Saccharospirillaceae bacterium]
MATVLPAFSYFPALNFNTFSFNAWFDLLQHPSFFSAFKLTVSTGFLSTSFSILFSFIIFYRYVYFKPSRFLNKILTPMLAIPHAAFAIAFILLLSPSGWLLKIIGQFVGWVIPPNIVTVNDSYALSLTLVLILKETPFLILMMMTQLPNIPVKSNRLITQSLGYSDFASFVYIMLPQLLKNIRLPIYAVLAFSLTVVDVAQIIGPNAPPTLGVLIHQWISNSDFTLRLQAASGAIFLLLLVVSFIVLFYVLEQCCIKLILLKSSASKRSIMFESVFAQLGKIIYFILLLSILVIVVLILWSVTFRWGFTDILPNSFSLKFWQKSQEALLLGLKNAFIFAMISTVLGLVLMVGALEFVNSKKTNRKYLPKTLMYLPLLLPQVSFLFGFNVFLLWFDFHYDWVAIIWAHSLFVMPYLYISLKSVFEKFDKRYTLQSYALNRGYFKTLFFIKLPMLKGSIYTAFALGFSVSVVQYLPTLYMGEGRIETITTQMVNMASGSDYRRIAIFALCQILLPLIIFIVASRKTRDA